MSRMKKIEEAASELLTFYENCVELCPTPMERRMDRLADALKLPEDPVHPLIAERLTDAELEALKHQGSAGPIMVAREPGLYLDGKPIEPEARDAILAALRLWQSVKDDIGDELMEIHTNGGEHAGMDSESIDALCEEINR